MINLTNNGIFPITVDKSGNPLPLPDTGFNYPGTIQGEGKYAGSLCLFIRTSGCNLRCSFFNPNGKPNLCDTPYSSFSADKNMWEVQDIVDTIKANSRDMLIKYVIISGGEPTMQSELPELLIELQKQGFHTTIETNATIFNKAITDNCDFISMSPKLSSSTPTPEVLKQIGISEKWSALHEKKRRDLQVIWQYIQHAKEYQLKFVVTNEEDVKEIISEFLEPLNLTTKDYSNVILMPEGITEEEVIINGRKTAYLAIKYGFGFTSRLHTLIWGTKAGV